MRKIEGCLIAALLMSALSGRAQTVDTGSIVGRVLEAETPLPGARVEVQSPALQGLRSDVTGSDGSFRFMLLPPGQYTLRATLDGFSELKQENIVVALTQTVTVGVLLRPAAAQEITVEAAAPLVDVTSALSGINITPKAMEALPLGRSYTAVAQIAPGVRSDPTGPTFYGSTGLENQYIIDGLNVTGLSKGEEGKAVNLDFVQEVQVMSGGLPAEYGRTTGGIVNAITRTGSNELRGGLFGYTTNRDLQSRPEYLNHLPDDQTQYSEIVHQFDYGASLGGPIWKDRIWFFGAYDRVSQRDVNVRLLDLTVPGFHVPAGGEIPVDNTTNLAAGKLTLAITPNQLLHLSAFGDNGVRSGALRAILGPPSTFEGVQKTGGTDYVGRYSGVFGRLWNVNGFFGRNTQSGRFTGPGSVTPVVVDDSHRPRTRSGGFGAYSNSRADRDVLKLDASTFVIGTHAIKLGGDEEKLRSQNRSFYSGGDRIFKRCSAALVNNECPASAFVFYTHLTNITSAVNPSDPSTFAAAIVNPRVTLYESKNQSVYIEDSWTAAPNLTLNAGFRLERQTLNNARRHRVLEVNNPAPRLGLVWDPRGDGRSRLYGYFGRFFESFTFDMERDFGGAGGFLIAYNLDPTPGNFTPDPRAPDDGNPNGERYIISLASDEGISVDPGFKGQFMDEYLLGYDRDLGNSVTAGVKGTYRNVGRVVEDIYTDPSGLELILGNPGSGQLSTIPFLSGDRAPTPKPIRRFAGVELHVSKRFNGTGQFFASYLLSRLYGNYEGLFLESFGQGNPQTSVLYDFADFTINDYGPLAADRTHQLKFYGSYQFRTSLARGLNIGVATHWYSGTPLTARSSNGYFLTKRGALGRGPADYEADIHLGYPISFLSRRFELVADVFNALDRQAPSSLDMAYNSGFDPPCTGIPAGLCNGAGGIVNKPGTTQPIGRIENPRATATNPNFLKPDGYSGARSIRLGARISF